MKIQDDKYGRAMEPSKLFKKKKKKKKPSFLYVSSVQITEDHGSFIYHYFR